jgi:hypothetical protein
MLHDWMIPSDLAPGDMKSLQGEWSSMELHRVESADDPDFDIAYGALWAEFGARSEVEQPTVLSRRLRWNGDKLVGGYALRYRLVLVKSQGKLAAVRDHTAVVRSGQEEAIVHLSHNFIAPEWRRSGLAGWLRALPSGAGTFLGVADYPCRRNEDFRPGRSGELCAFECL